MEKIYNYGAKDQFKAFDNMLEGVSVYKLIFDKGKVIDAIFEYINPTTIETMNLNPAETIGKSALEVLGLDFIQPYLNAVDVYYKTGEIKRFEVYYQPTDKYFIISGFELGDNLFAVLRMDITDRKLAEDALKESEEKFKTIFHSANDSIFLHEISNEGIPGKFIEVNKVACKTYGYTREEFRNMTPKDIVSPQDKDKIYERGIKLIEEGYNTFESIDIAKNGKKILIEVNSHLMKLKGKDLVLSISRDITERKRMEDELKKTRDNLENIVQERTEELEKAYESLKESEEKFRLFFDKSTDMISLSEIKENGLPGKYIEINETGFKRLGYTKQEMLNMGPTDIIAPEERAQMPKNAVEMDKKGFSSFEIVHLTKEGKKIPVEINGHIINYHGRKVYLTVSRDITERKKTENELQRTKESFKTLAENSPDLIFRVNKDLKCLYVNSKITEFTNMPSNFFIGKNVDELGLPEKYTSLFKEDYYKLFKTGKKQNLEYTLPTVEGYKFFYATTVPEFNSKGDIQTALTVIRDITDRKQAEERLKETIQELERSNQELQSFAYITSHDLQEPLRTIVSYSQLIERRYKGQLDEDADDFLNFMVSAATRMKEMIQGLLDYSRINRAGKKFVKTKMNLNVEKAIDNLQSTIEESKAEITHDNLPNIIADPNQMTLVFQNLIGNAIKYKKPEIPPKIHIATRVDKNKREWVFSVSDNGIGMEPQYTDKIFEVFRRLHTIDKYEGTGIGLAIFKRIIERHGGRVWVESSLGKGSTFYFTIPVENTIKMVRN